MNQMEIIQGGGKNRDCAIIGGVTVAAIGVLGWVGFFGGMFAAASAGCFS